MRKNKKVDCQVLAGTVRANDFASLFESYERVFRLLEDFLVWSQYPERRGCSMRDLAIDVTMQDMPEIRRWYRKHLAVAGPLGLGDPALGCRNRDEEL
jgi:hypothetical protein